MGEKPKTAFLFMASSEKNLSTYSDTNVLDVSKKNFAIVVAEWNTAVTEALYNGALSTLKEHGVTNVIKADVPGTFELSYAAQKLAQREDIDAVICIGCVIKGETKHNDYISHAVAQGLTNVSLKYDKPVVFGVLTPDTQNKRKIEPEDHSVIKVMKLRLQQLKC